jgi:hypothetical protein
VVVRELLGARDLTFAEATRNVAGLYTEMTRAINEGKVKSLEGRRPENTTRTTFEEFAESLARAYQAA